MPERLPRRYVRLSNQQYFLFVLPQNSISIPHPRRNVAQRYPKMRRDNFFFADPRPHRSQVSRSRPRSAHQCPTQLKEAGCSPWGHGEDHPVQNLYIEYANPTSRKYADRGSLGENDMAPALRRMDVLFQSRQDEEYPVFSPSAQPSRLKLWLQIEALATREVVSGQAETSDRSFTQKDFWRLESAQRSLMPPPYPPKVPDRLGSGRH